MQRCRSSRATSSETSRDVRCAASKPITRTGLLYWPSNKSSTTLSMVSSRGGIRHADGGGIDRSLAVAATLHCTMNTWGFLPLFFTAPTRRIKWRNPPRILMQYCTEEPSFNTEHIGYTETVELRLSRARLIDLPSRRLSKNQGVYQRHSCFLP